VKLKPDRFFMKLPLKRNKAYSLSSKAGNELINEIILQKRMNFGEKAMHGLI
jgi:hypothetical protein